MEKICFKETMTHSTLEYYLNLRINYTQLITSTHNSHSSNLRQPRCKSNSSPLETTLIHTTLPNARVRSETLNPPTQVDVHIVHPRSMEPAQRLHRLKLIKKRTEPKHKRKTVRRSQETSKPFNKFQNAPGVPVARRDHEE